MNEIQVRRSKIAKVEQLDDFVDEYVYDIGVDNETPYFFGDNILLHNSVYYTLEKLLGDELDNMSVEDIISLYDQAADSVNESFPGFMDRHFHTGLERGAIIKAGRELVAISGLFIKKKKYAVLMIDKEGKRLDVDGKPGKIKAMGLDLKRADTPKIMQKFLESFLLKLLNNTSKEELIELLRVFRTDEFRKLKPWEKGTPKRCNGITDHQTKQMSQLRNVVIKPKSKDKRVVIPGHVQAGINWNRLREQNGDLYSMAIQDGQKVIVCKLIQNNMGMTSVAYPIDQTHLPEWFTSLPFDIDQMEEDIIDAKIKNLIGCLGWDLIDAKEHNTFGDLFEF
jgi:hypothetical protein